MPPSRSKARPASRGRCRRLAAALAVLCLALTPAGCGQGSQRERAGALQNPTLGGTDRRVSPAYAQWLSRQGMLSRAEELVQSVSGTARLWGHSSGVQDIGLVLKAAPSWLALNPWRAGLGTPFAKHLGDIDASLAAWGFQGIYLSPLLETDGVWLNDRSTARFGSSACSIAPAHEAGQAGDIASRIGRVESLGLQQGTAIVPAATGMGPDFMLQARRHATHQGLYCMMEIPKAFWPELSKAADSWDCAPLSAKVCARLAEGGVIPRGLAQDKAAGALAAGWAATGEVLGTDGVLRRYAYRWALSPWRPVLLWQDPSGRARTLLAGSIIQTTGLQRQTLAGISLAGLKGLDAPGPDPAAPSLAPAPEALADMTGQVHRYGGWSLLADSASAADGTLSRFLACADFVAVPELPGLVRQAFQSGSAAPVAALLESLAALGPDARRLALGLEDAESPQTSAGLAMALLGRSGPALGEDRAKAASLVHAMAALPCALPGLCFVAYEDLAGLAKPGDPGSALFAWPERGRGEAALAQEPAALLAGTLKVRAERRAAEGRIAAIAHSPSALAVANGLPDGSLLVCAVNFSGQDQVQTIAIPPACKVHRIETLTPGATGAARLSGRVLTISLNARQAVHVLVDAGNGRKGL